MCTILPALDIENLRSLCPKAAKITRGREIRVKSETAEKAQLPFLQCSGRTDERSRPQQYVKDYERSAGIVT